MDLLRDSNLNHPHLSYSPRFNTGNTTDHCGTPKIHSRVESLRSICLSNSNLFIANGMICNNRLFPYARLITQITFLFNLIVTRDRKLLKTIAALGQLWIEGVINSFKCVPSSISDPELPAASHSWEGGGVPHNNFALGLTTSIQISFIHTCIFILG